MKKYILLLVVFLLSVKNFSQETHVQIKTNSHTYANVGFGEYYGSNTSDSGLNTIFSNNQISQCYNGSHQVDNANVIFAICLDINLSNFIQNLLDYSTLVTKISICPQADTFGDILMATLVSESIGIPTGIDTDGIVTTNDAGLSQIFSDYNVTYFSRTYPGSSSSSLARVYTSMCNCNVSDFKAALTSYNSVIEAAYYYDVAFLSIIEYNIENTSIYPNPFSSTFTIDSKEPISNYSIFDVSGKKLIESDFENELVNQSSKLNSGIFFLKILFQNGKFGNYKLVKK